MNIAHLEFCSLAVLSPQCQQGALIYIMLRVCAMFLYYSHFLPDFGMIMLPITTSGSKYKQSTLGISEYSYLDHE